MNLVTKVSLGAAVALGFLGLIWPTPYVITTSRGGETVMRVNRFTGVQEFATERGWRTNQRMLEDSLDESYRELEAMLKRGEVTSYAWDHRPGLVLQVKSSPDETVGSVHQSHAARFIRLLEQYKIPKEQTIASR